MSSNTNNEPFTNEPVQHLSHNTLENVPQNSPQDDGEWKVVTSKSKNKAASGISTSTKQPLPQYFIPNPLQNYGKKPAEIGNFRTQSSSSSGHESAQLAKQHVQHRNWHTRPGLPQTKGKEVVAYQSYKDTEANKDSDIDIDIDIDGDDDDLDAEDESDFDILSDEFDSDTGEKGDRTWKQNKWFKTLFETIEALSTDEINNQYEHWRCPACQGGSGANEWYKGMQSLVKHAKTKGSRRVKLHREFAQVLEDVLNRKGAFVSSLVGETFDRWNGLEDDKEKDRLIVWPPMVIIMNTFLEQNVDGKWIGMGNQGLLEYFSEYAVKKARHSYGPQGHRGISVLIFEKSARGYFEADHLHKHFADQNTDRDAWNRCPVSFSSGRRQLYGFKAIKEDLDEFNKHSQGKTKIKFEMKSYQEMVLNQIRKMSEENEELIYVKDEVAKLQRTATGFKESLSKASEKLRRSEDEKRIMRQRTKQQHEEDMEAIISQEQFYQEQIKIIQATRDSKEEDLGSVTEEQDTVKYSNSDLSIAEKYQARMEEIFKCSGLEDKEMQEHIAKKENLVRTHEDKKVKMRKRHTEEELGLEKELEANLNHLIDLLILKDLPQSLC